MWGRAGASSRGPGTGGDGFKEEPMADPTRPAPGEPRPIPDATLSLFAVALVELRRDLRQLVDSRWNEAVRRRAEELSSTLGQACQRMGLAGLQPFLRSLTNLTRVPRADALP